MPMPARSPANCSRFARISNIELAARLDARPQRTLHVHRVGVTAFRMGRDRHLEQFFTLAVIAAHHGERRRSRLYPERLCESCRHPPRKYFELGIFDGLAIHLRDL